MHNWVFRKCCLIRAKINFSGSQIIALWSSREKWPMRMENGKVIKALSWKHHQLSRSLRRASWRCTYLTFLSNTWNCFTEKLDLSAFFFFSRIKAKDDDAQCPLHNLRGTRVWKWWHRPDSTVYRNREGLGLSIPGVWLWGRLNEAIRPQEETMRLQDVCKVPALQNFFHLVFLLKPS